jgi:hypothetical protein
LPIIALVLMSCQFLTIDIARNTVLGSGEIETETRDVAGFDRVTLEDRGELTIIQGDEEGLTVEADDNLLPLIRTEVRGNDLLLEVDDDYDVRGDATIRYTLRVKDLESISVVGAGNVDINSLETSSLTLRVSGSGNVDIKDLQAGRLSSETSGSGNFTLSGAVESQSLTINGAGNYLAGDLESQQTRVEINGAGNATVWAKDTLDIRISGFGNVDYYGSPKVTQSMAGGGGIDALGTHK